MFGVQVGSILTSHTDEAGAFWRIRSAAVSAAGVVGGPDNQVPFVGKPVKQKGLCWSSWSSLAYFRWCKYIVAKPSFSCIFFYKSMNNCLLEVGSVVKISKPLHNFENRLN